MSVSPIVRLITFFQDEKWSQNTRGRPGVRLPRAHDQQFIFLPLVTRATSTFIGPTSSVTVTWTNSVGDGLAARAGDDGLVGTGVITPPDVVVVVEQGRLRRRWLFAFRVGLRTNRDQTGTQKSPVVSAPMAGYEPSFRNGKMLTNLDVNPRRRPCERARREPASGGARVLRAEGVCAPRCTSK